MKNFIVYDSETGDIKRSGMCQNHMLEAQAHENESVMEGYLAEDPLWFYVDTSSGTPELKRIS